MFNLFNYQRRQTHAVQIGKVTLGATMPVRVQSMANTDTNDTVASAEQCIRIVDAGGEIVRFTAQGVKEAENLRNIHELIREKGYDVPLVADIHFNANAADVAATHVEKVRVNPGNFVSAVKNDGTDYSDEEYLAEQLKLRTRFIQLLQVCKQHGTAIRIGVNHGSLSERMMNRWGDTPRGMVESCMELLEVCRQENFQNVVISMKASNTLSMVHAVRLLVSEMDARDMHFPLHLGVTEAGDGEDGRIKSSVGIGTLLHDGIGDTIRVSLSEEPEAEIPVARLLVSHITSKSNHEKIDAPASADFNIFEYSRRKTYQVDNIGGEQVPVVIMANDGDFQTIPDFLMKEGRVYSHLDKNYPVFNLPEFVNSENTGKCFLKLHYKELNNQIIDRLKNSSDVVVLLHSEHQNQVGEMRAFFHKLLIEGIETPVVLCRKYRIDNVQELQIKAAADLGPLLLDGFGDGIFIEPEVVSAGLPDMKDYNSVAFGILQAARVRISKTEYISCPGCGRTMFKLQTVIARVKARTSHLKGLKIAVMGCIVNGPGEMADADYGYVGAGRGKVSLYKKKECIERGINEEEAVDRLITLIQQYGDWHD
jgi:(E)-4-hydroxy-3-methylbut-2-enyl-diphosphate synthase